MIEEKWYLEWNWIKDQDLLVIHVFPHRTFLIRSNKIHKKIIPYLAGFFCFSVILGQNNDMTVEIESKEGIPIKMDLLSNKLKEISHGKFDLKFNNLYGCQPMQKSDKNVLLFSGGKDSLWQLNYIKNNYEYNNLNLLYVSGTTITGEYIQEMKNAKCLSEEKDLNIVSVESYDYTNIGLNFCYRPRWRCLVLIGIARMFSNEIWTGISEDKRFIEGGDLAETDVLTFFSEMPQTLELLTEILNCNIWLSPPESYCFFDLESQNIHYRSCYSSDVICSPKSDFKNSCWKCKTLHIYKKISQNLPLNSMEDDFFESDNWPGDEEEVIKKNKNIDKMKPSCISNNR